MKKLFLTIIFCLFASVGYAADYWVYIRTYDKPELVIGGAGRSKKGDIVQVLACQATNDKGVVFNRVPSAIEQKEWLILKVSDIPEEKIRLAMESWQEQTGVTPDGQPIYTARAYRRYKIPDLDKLKDILKISVSTGIVPITFTNNKLTIEEKTVLDLAKYEQDTKTYLATQKIRKPFEYVLRLLLPFAYAANTTNTVNTDGGGDYLTLSAAEDAIDGTAYGAGETATINCAGTTADTTAVEFSEWDTDADIRVIGNFVGTKYDSTKYHMIVASTAININNSGLKITISNVQIIQNNNNGITMQDGRVDNIWRIYDNLIIKTAGTTNNRYGVGISGGGTFYVYNNIIIGFCGVDNGVGISAHGSYTCTVYIYNNTVDQAGIGSYGIGINCVEGTGNGTFYAKNNIVVAGTNYTPIIGTMEAGCGYNATNKSSLGASYSVTGGAIGDRVSQTFTFVDGTNADLTLRDYALQSSDSGAKDFGTNSVDSLFTTDINGITRLGTWDIGADEYVAAGGARRRIFID